MADSESGPDTGANELDGSVDAFIEDLESLVKPQSGAEGVGVGADVYGAVVRRWMLERHDLR